MRRLGGSFQGGDYMTNTEVAGLFEVAWDGSFDGSWWRAHGQTVPEGGYDAPRPSQAALVREVLEAHPNTWFSVKQLALEAGTSYDDAGDRAARFAQYGVCERMKDPGGHWVYRMRAGYEADRREDVRRMSAQMARARNTKRLLGRDRAYRSTHEIEAMRARLHGGT